MVLTHPANWGEFKLDLLREAGRLAGVEDVTLLSEPEAAARQYVHLGRVKPGDAVAVYDFGGGTFDVAVVRCDPTGERAAGHAPGTRAPGRTRSRRRRARARERVARRPPRDDRSRGSRRIAVHSCSCAPSARGAKEALSLDSEASIPIALPDLVTEVRITRDEFEGAVRSAPRRHVERVRPCGLDRGAHLRRSRRRAARGWLVADPAGVRARRGAHRASGPRRGREVGRVAGRSRKCPSHHERVVDRGDRHGRDDRFRAVEGRRGQGRRGARSGAKKEGAAKDAKKGDGKGKGMTRTIAGREVNLGRVAAGAAGVAAAGAAVAGAAASGLLDDDAASASTTTTDPDAPAQQHEGRHGGGGGDDDSLDEFDTPGRRRWRRFHVVHVRPPWWRRWWRKRKRGWRRWRLRRARVVAVEVRVEAAAVRPLRPRCNQRPQCSPRVPTHPI